MAIASSDTTASQGASASGAIAGAGGTAASGASSSAQPSASGPAAAQQQLIVRPPLDVYKKLAIVRLPDDEVMYQNADGSWGKVKNLDETRVVNKKKGDEEADAEMTDEADDSNKSEEDADDEKKEDGSEEVSLGK